MNHRTKNILIGLFLIGLSAILKFYFKTPNIGILFLVVLGAISGLTTVLVKGFINFEIFLQFQKLKRRKGSFLPERQLVKDSALLIKQNGEKIKGKLVLTNDHLIFLGNGKEEESLEKEVCQINPNISKAKFLGIPDGFRLENDDIVLKVSFPYYWLKKINKLKATA